MATGEALTENVPKKIFLLVLSAAYWSAAPAIIHGAIITICWRPASVISLTRWLTSCWGCDFSGEARRMQWLAVILAACGVLVQLGPFGFRCRFIALGLAFKFAFYGLAQRRSLLKRRRRWLKRYGCCRSPRFICFGIADKSTNIWGKTHYRRTYR